jgi:hypothetical protein
MVTAVKAGKHICLSPSRFRDLVDAGVFERMPPGKYDLTTVREAYCLYAQKVMQGRGDDGGKALSERRGRLAEAQTIAVETKNAIMTGEFVRLVAVQNVLEREFSSMKEKILSTPGKSADALQPFTALDRGAIFDVLHAEAIELLESLSTSAVLAAAVERGRGKHRERDADAAGDARA